MLGVFFITANGKRDLRKKIHENKRLQDGWIKKNFKINRFEKLVFLLTGYELELLYYVYYIVYDIDCGIVI